MATTQEDGSHDKYELALRAMHHVNIEVK